VFVGAFDSLAAASGWWDRTRKGLGIIFLAIGLLLIGQAFLGHATSPAAPGHSRTAVVAATPATGEATPAATETAAVLPAEVPWEKTATGEGARAFLDAKLAAAKAEGRPVMIDFWAAWCVYCKKLDQHVWNDPAVVAESQRFVTLKVDATAPDDEEMTAIKEAWDVAGLPRVVFLDSRGEYLAGRSTGFNPAPKMLEIMQSIR
jgi:thiol:disulfide interchange protein DsbD